MSLLCRVYLLQLKKKKKSYFLAYTLRHRVLSLSLSLSLSWSVLDSSYMDTCVENYLIYWHIISLSLSLSLMECARLIMYGCMHWELSYISAILSLSHTTYGYISISHIWNNYCVLEFVVVKTSSVISKVPTQLGGSLVNFCNNK